MKTTLYKKDVKKVARRLAACCLLFFAMAGNAWAQNSSNPRYVIKKDGHYLSHVKIEATMLDHQGNDSTYWYWVLRDVEAFHPDSCLWYSGPNYEHNYYFVDHEGKYRYLNAPLEKDGEIEISSSHPGTQVLNETASDYYFYDWDHGSARGVQHFPTPENPCNPEYHIPPDVSQCWEVVWVSYDNDTWKMSSIWSYNPTPATKAAPYRHVEITSHDEEVSGESGGITGLVLDDIVLETVGQTASPDGTASKYNYTITPSYALYDFEAVNNNFFNVAQELHYFFSGEDHDAVPTTTYTDKVPTGYAWTLTGDDALTYLTLTDPDEAQPTLRYAHQNESNSHKTFTLTLTVTYDGGATQTCSTTVTVKTQCQNPQQASAPVITYDDVTVSWLPTANSYKVYWSKDNWATYGSDLVVGATSYSIIGLEYATTYQYKVTAICDGVEPENPTEYTFTTKDEPKVLIEGAVFGGGRMANVVGKTEVVIINCDSISAVYGGNDIAGVVQGDDGSAITLGVVSGEYATYGTTSSSIGVRIGDVYGGGNGYYAYNGTSFEPASYNTTYTIEAGASINAMTNQHTVGDPVWTNTTDQEVNFVCPTISKSNIVVNTNYVKIDSVFGGAKNAILNNQTNDVNITVNGGTIYAVFAGNNFGGSLGYTSTENIVINNTKTKTSVSDYNANKLGHDFGIGYVFGGGNKVIGQNAVITVNGGQCDTIFGGGNAADVSSTIVNMQCSVASGSGVTFGNTYSNAINSYNEGVITTKDDYKWNGTGIYNVRTLFGGNNRADMAGLPTLNLTSGSVGTVYGGGNAGNMVAQETDDCTTNHGQLVINGNNVKYGTHVKMDKETMLVDVLYGGCQMSNVNYSTWVEIAGGHVGTVYGGCNISGDVGSTRVDLDATPFINVNDPNPAYQKVYGATYVVASHGTVHQNLFAGSNGYYHCNDGFRYISGLNYADPEERYVGMYIPTHNETYAIIQGDVLVKGNVYAGANLAPVGFTTAYVSHFQSYSSLVGLASVRMSGGTVEGNVFGGGNMASINGSNEVQVSGGSIGYIGDAAIGGALYGGNDRTGQAGQISNRILPEDYNVASDGHTSIEDVRTYVGVTGNPRINTVYGGGNGYYAYFDNIDDYNAYTGPLDKVLSCNPNDLPTQSDIFVDIAIDGSAGTDGTGYINYVYGGGNGVSVDPNGFLKVFLNVKNFGEDDADHVGTLFGGNNMGDLEIVPNIILLNGKVNTVYGGCNSGAMQGTTTVEGEDGTLYENVGSFVHTRSSYDEYTVTPTAQVTGYVYGGCRSNGVSNNTLVLVEGGNHPATFFGGSDVSGIVGGTTQVIVKGGSTGDVFGGGNGTGSVTPPYCNYTHVEALGGTCTGDVFGGGLAGPCGETHVTVDRVTVNGTVVDRGTVNGSVFGGGYAGVSGETHVTIADGTVRGSVFGGGNEAGLSTEDLNPDPEITQSFSGNSNILMSGGFVKGEVDPDRFGMGMFGGCNAEGSIAGDVAITLTGGTIGTEEHPANVHGGGYGQPTTVAGDVLINFGQTIWDNTGETPVEIHNENLNLYGDLYGGSALGSVNTNATNTTTIRIDNGTINGNVYGGGLGDAADGTKGWTKGVVHVFVGGENNGTYFGMASFNDCSIFGCNNLNGSPQTDVYVDVYQTAHNEEDVYDTGEEFAIYRVFGGGNQADYAPENGSPSSLKVAHVHIHGCLNTIEEVYGGSNQANAISTRSVVDGGRFNYIFGGGNGLGGPADVGVDERIHSTFSQIKGGHVAFCFGGSNSQGNCINIVQSFETDNPPICDALEIDNIYNGGNFADQVGEMVLNFSCETPENYKKAYGGCRLGTVYGNITVNVYGGIIGTLFGGCQGEGGTVGEEHPSNVKKYDNDHYPAGHPELIGTGGNITVNLYGGTIGEVYGGCDINGNVEGRISINVYHIENNCGLFIGNIYGASNQTDYTPVDLASGIASPKVSVIKATVGGHNNDLEQTYTGNVFGGGNLGKVTSNSQVIIGEHTNTKPVTIKGDVYGGGDHGEINGTTGVIVVPNSHTLTINAPESGSGNAFRVTDILGNTVTSGASIDEYSDLKLVAMPSVYGQRFTGWTIGGGANVIDNTLVSTTFVMGTGDAEITAGFASATTHPLTVVVNNSLYGSVSVIDPQGHTVDLTQGISEGAELTLVATPVTGYAFAGWTVEGENAGVITSLLSPTTTFVMGTGDATIRATFLPTHTLTINIVRPENSSVSVMVTDAQGNIINSGDAVREGAVLNLVATHAQGYSFDGWSCIGTGSSIGNSSSATTTFIMGSEDATLTATFTEGRAYNDRNSNR